MCIIWASIACHGDCKRLYIVQHLVRALRDSRANLMPIYGDLYQIELWGITNENHLVTHLGFTSGRHYDVIKITYIVLVQSKRYVHCSLWRSGLSCILFANFSRNAQNLILGGKQLKLTCRPYCFRIRTKEDIIEMTPNMQIPHIYTFCPFPTHGNILLMDW